MSSATTETLGFPGSAGESTGGATGSAGSADNGIHQPVIPELSTARFPRVSGVDALLSQIGEAIDASVLMGMQVAVDSLLMPTPEHLPELQASADSLRVPELIRSPATFFDFGAHEPTAIANRSRAVRDLPGGVVVRRRFTGAYSPYSSDVDEVADRRHDEIHVEHWMHDGGKPRASVLAVHGFTMGRPRVDAVVLFARQLYERGLDIALITLPHHGARTPEDARFSGQAFAVPHVSRLAGAVRQAIYEMRLVTGWLRSETHAPVGVMGLSLGGYLTALMADLYGDLDFAIPMAPPICMGDLAWRFFTRSRHYADGAQAAFSRDELRASFRVHSPLAHPLQTPRERVLIVAGRGDRIVPPEHPHNLWLHWGEPDIHWFSGGHLAPFRRGRIVDAIDAHLHELDIL